MYEFLSTAPQGITINKAYGAIRIDETVPVGNYTVYARAKLYTYVHSGNPPPKVLVLKTSDEVAVSIVVEGLPTK